MHDLTELQRKTLKCIYQHSNQNPITGKEIANLIGLVPRDTGKEGADMRSVINALRSKGYPICASGEGYWYPRNKADLDEFVQSFQGRIDSQQKALMGIRAGVDKIILPITNPATQVDVPLASTIVARFESRTRRGVYHKVIQKGGMYVCDCESYNFRKSCTHTDSVIKQKTEESMDKMF